VYNQPNVQLVDINETPIERITPTGIKTGDAEYKFDIIIYATGFDAITGSFDRIDIRGVDGMRLKDKWSGGPQTYLGVLVEGFPDMMMLIGPHTALGNIPRSIEYNVAWVTGLVGYARDHGLTRVEATKAGVTSCTEHVRSLGVGLLSNEIDSWMTSINRNVEGKQTRIIARYSGRPRRIAPGETRWRSRGIGSPRWRSDPTPHMLSMAPTRAPLAVAFSGSLAR
jgi:hypothetical protein